MTLAIEELVLRGFPAAHRHRFADALTEELRALPWPDVSPVVSVPPLTLRMREGDSPERAGRELARALHTALTTSVHADDKERRKR